MNSTSCTNNSNQPGSKKSLVKLVNNSDKTDENTNTFTNILPVELQIKIFEYLDQSTLLHKTSLVSKDFLRLSRNPLIWKNLEFSHRKYDDNYIMKRNVVHFLKTCQFLKHLEFKHIQVSKSFFGRLPSIISESVSTVTISDSLITIQFLSDLMLRFPNIRHMKFQSFIILRGPHLTKLQTVFQTITRIDMILVCYYFFKKFMHYLSQCNTLATLKMKWGDREKKCYRSGRRFNIYEIMSEHLSCCRYTLKKLSIKNLVLPSYDITSLCLSFPNITRFTFECNQTANEEMFQALNVLNLKKLKIKYDDTADCLVTSETLCNFFQNTRNRKGLNKLNLANFSNCVDNFVLETIIQHCENLHSLHITGSDSITQEGFHSFMTTVVKEHRPSISIRFQFCSQLMVEDYQYIK